MTNLEELKGLAYRLRALVDDPQPGLLSWWAALAEVLKQLKPFIPTEGEK